MDTFENKMNKAFQKLAADIIPSDEYLEKANHCATNVIKLLQAKSKFDIDRVCNAGSSGKKTTIMGSDIDLVLFVNGERPPFKNVLEDFEIILTTTDSYKIRDVRKTKFSIQFKALEFEFDILPAANFTKGLQVGDDKLIDIQQEQVLRIIKQDPKKYGYMYSSSLAFSAVRFMKRQDGFVNEMVRIAKFWYKTLHFNDYVSGAKSCIELIAAHAAIQEKRMDNTSYLRSFARFIKCIKNFDNLNIHFEEDEQRVLDKVRPRVMDPVTPYNNLARNWDTKSIKLVKIYAEETGRRLDFLANLHIARLDQLFEPQPVFRPDIREIFEINPTRSQWLVGTVTFSLLPDLKIRNNRFYTDFKLKMGLETLKTYLQCAIFSANASGCDANQIQEVVQNTIDKHIRDTKSTWVIRHEKHEDYDITFTIPFNSTTAVRISYRL